MDGVDSYVAHARPERTAWVLHVTGPGVDGVTQSHTLRGAEAMARDYVANVLDADDTGQFDLELVAQARQPWWRELRNSLRR